MLSNFHPYTEKTSTEKSAVNGSQSPELEFPVKETRLAYEQYSNSGAKIICVPLSPYEKGFFCGVEGGRVNQQVMREVYAMIADRNETKALQRIYAMGSNPGSVNKNDKGLLQLLPPNLPESRIQYFQQRKYDYFEELKNQYKLYLTGELIGGYVLVSRESEGAHIPIQSNGPQVAFIVEGIHALGVGNPEDEFLHAGQRPHDVSIGRLKSRIRQLKGEEPLEDHELKRWSHRPFLFRLANHFGNGLFGHARSFPQRAEVILDQRRYLNKGVIKGSGYEVVTELLGLNEDLRPTGSKRILIDMLHLSASARNDLYEKVFRTFNKNIDPQHPIPVVFTNAAYSGVDYLAEMMKNSRDGVDRDDFRVHGFYGGSVNLSDEDVLAVFWSKGLIGITLEEKKMGHELTGLAKLFPKSSRTQALRMLGRQVAGIVSVPFAYHVCEPLNIWNCLGIGSGLSGTVQLLEYFKTSNNLHSLVEDLEEVLTKLKKEEPFWFGPYKPAELARKICYENIIQFSAKNF